MALVPQTRKRKIELINQYMKGKLQEANLLLYREEDTEGIHDATYKATLQEAVYDIEKDIISMLRWLAASESFTVPAAFNDAQVDAINPLIRQYEDGL
jgi:hypothetical protein